MQHATNQEQHGLATKASIGCLNSQQRPLWMKRPIPDVLLATSLALKFHSLSQAQCRNVWKHTHQCSFSAAIELQELLTAAQHICVQISGMLETRYAYTLTGVHVKRGTPPSQQDSDLDTHACRSSHLHRDSGTPMECSFLTFSFHSQRAAQPFQMKG